MNKEAVKTNNEEAFKEKFLLWMTVNAYDFFLIDGLMTASNPLRIAVITVRVIWGILSAILIHGIYSNVQEKARRHCIYALLAVVVLDTVLFAAVLTPAFRKTQLYYNWKCGSYERVETINVTIKKVGNSEYHSGRTTAYIYTYVTEDENGNTALFEDHGKLWNAAVKGKELPISITIDKTDVDRVYLYGMESIKRIG